MRANREAHQSLFLKAQEGYRKLVIEELDRMLADAKAGLLIRRSVTLTEPSGVFDQFSALPAIVSIA